MTDRIAHRGPDAGGVWSHEDERVSLHLGTGGCRSSTCPRRPTSRCARATWPCSTTANCTTQGTTRGTAGEGSDLRHLVGHRGRTRGLAALGPGRLRQVPRHVRARHRRYCDRRIGARPRPAGHQAPFYVERGDGIVFASELKAIISAMGAELRIEPGDAGGLHALLLGPRAALRHPGRAQAPGRHLGQDQARAARLRSAVLAHQDVAAAGQRQPAADLKSVIEESVKAHLVADVPVSSFLSGGLDSSIVTVLAHQDSAGVDAYTITFRPEDQKLEAMPDDAVYARKVARQFGIDLHEIELSPDIVDLLPRMVDILDEPIGDPAAINTLLMCEAARERGVKVLLSGMGADELFGGYRKQLACLMASRYRRLPGAVRWPGPRRGEQPAGVHRRPRPALPPVGQAVHDVRRAARGGQVPPQLHAVRPGGADGAGRPGARCLRRRRDRRACRHLQRQRRSTTRSTGCASPTPGCSWRGST